MKKNFLKKVLTTGIAAAMVMAMSVPAFAGTYDNGTTDTSDDVTVIDNYTITKNVTNLSGSTYTTPGQTYTFTVTPATGSPKPAALDSNNQITVTLADDTLTGVTSAVFATSDFTAAGIYTYTITESGTSDDHWTYDTTSYTVRVKVTNVNGTVAIAGITASNGTDKVSTIAFNNKYTAWGNTTTTTGSGSDTGLVVSKTLSGEDYSTSDSFTFSITFAKGTYTGDVVPSETTSYGTGTIAYGTAYTFTMTGGQSANFKVPAGVTYTVSETNSGSYTNTTVSVNSGTATTATTSGEQTISTSANTVTFDNSKSSTVLTGIINNYGGLLALVAIAAAGMILVMVRRRRMA